MPKSYGGMGVTNLRIQNIAFLLRWWWRPYAEAEALWTITINKLRRTGHYANGPKFWAATGSFFWNQLIKLRPLFTWSTTWTIGIGAQISFWQDGWGGLPLDHNLKERTVSPFMSLRDAVQVSNFIAPEYVNKVEGVRFTQQRDQIVWKWENGGMYTALSMYKLLTEGGLIREKHARLWRSKTTPTVRIFAYLLLKNRILTHDVMSRRNMRCSLTCVLCDNCLVESAFHIFFLCPYVVHIWFLLGMKMGFAIIRLGPDLETTWTRSLSNVKHRGTHWKEKGMLLLLSTLWTVWKQHNARIFAGEWIPPKTLVERIWEDVALRMQYC